jgi:hypothetical protein
MALIDDFIGTPRHSVHVQSFGAEVFQTIGLAISALAAGGRAAHDYERLRARRAMPAEELPQEIYRRHFARLAVARAQR